MSASAEPSRERALYMHGVRRIVKTRGFLIQSMSYDPPFSYTVGLLDKIGFELITFTLDATMAGSVLYNTVDEIVAGTKFPLDEPVPNNKIIERYPVLFKRCDPELQKGYLHLADTYWVDKPVVARQLVLPDSLGRFPGEDGYDMLNQTLLYK